jgi:hypothetical protein
MNGQKSEKLVIKEEATVAEYVNAAAAASNRARNVIIVLVVATVLLAIEMRNTSFSWLDERIAVRAEAIKLLQENYDYEASDPDKEQPKVPSHLFLKDHRLRPNNTLGRELLARELDDYRKSAIEQVSLFHVPFFGAVFDHNDIGMFGGITFAVVLLWLRYSLAREVSNLNLLFDYEIEKSVFRIDPKRCYDLLAMQQVLTVPRLPNSPTRHRWRWIPKLLYGIPAVVYFGQLFFDFLLNHHGMWRVGEVLGKGKMWLLVVSSSSLFVVVLVFTVWCIRILREIDRVWDRAVLHVYPELIGTKKRRRRRRGIAAAGSVAPSPHLNPTAVVK